MSQSDHIMSLEGTVVGDTYRVGKCIGQGAMGAVFEAVHLRLAGRYAIKVLQSDIAAHPEVLSRFQREATIMSQLRHPNIVSVLDFNVTPDGRPFLAMEMLDGIELTEAIRRSAPMSLPQVFDIVGQVALALSAAHTLGIVHRDLKPQNLFLLRLPGDDRQVVKVLDFGISKVHEATTQLTQANAVMGTPQYMAPEQALGQVALMDQRVDQFALGAITYELLTGRPAFRGDSIPAVLYQVVHEQPPSIRSFNPAVSARVESAVMRALAKAAVDRFATVRDFHAALTEGERPQATPARGTTDERAVATAGTISARGRTTAVTAKETSAAGAETTFSTAMAELGPETLAVVRTHRRRIVVTGLLAGATLVGAWLMMRAPKRAGHEVSTMAPAPAIPVEPPAPIAAPAAAVPPAPAPVQIRNPPPGLTVTVDQTPAALPLALPRADRRYTLRFEAPGFEAEQIVVDGNQPSHEIALALHPVPGKAKPTVPPAAKPPGARLLRDLGPAAPAPASPTKPRGHLITDF